ncbi:MAG: hypothetical protein JWQ18_3524, partial [Conexibacter sp.]|nr:hypothetical protein [Conexibacter sp.]
MSAQSLWVDPREPEPERAPAPA